MSHSVVIAEDESIIRLDLREMLTDEGYNVVGETGDGDEAVRLALELKPDFCIFDVQMPGRDGIDAAREVMEHKHSAVIILTAYSQRHLIEQARDAGVLTYLVKPFQRDVLVSALEVALARFEELRALDETVATLEDQLETRKLLDRAKGLLMDEHKMSEREAFEFVRKAAMDNRATMADTASRVIAGALTP